VRPVPKEIKAFIVERQFSALKIGSEGRVQKRTYNTGKGGGPRTKGIASVAKNLVRKHCEKNWKFVEREKTWVTRLWAAFSKILLG